MAKRKKEVQGRIEIKLKYPLIIDGIPVIESVFLERLKTKHLKKFPESLIEKLQGIKQDGKKAGVEDLIPVLQIMTGLSNEEMDEVDFLDLNNIVDILTEHDFL